MQAVYGAEGPIDKDPFYLEGLVENASKILSKSNMEVDLTINPQQAATIISIAQLDFNKETKMKLYEFALRPSKEAEEFLKIVNKITELSDYLPNLSAPNNVKLVETHGEIYKKTVILHTFDFLSKSKPSVKDKEEFVSNIHTAERQFSEQALSKERGTISNIMMFLTNFILYVSGIATGLGPLINIAHKANTGDWLLSQRTQSEYAIRETWKNLFKELDSNSQDDSEQTKVDKGP